MRIQAILGLVLTLSLFSTAFAAPPQGTKPKPVKRPKEEETLYQWLDKTEPLTVAKLGKLVDWASLSAESDMIVKAAMARYGATDLESFLPLFVVDEPKLEITGATFSRKGGETQYGELSMESIDIAVEDQCSGADLENIEPYRSQIEALRVKHGAYLAYTVNRTVDLRVYLFSKPSIFLAREESLRQSYESFIHELTHFIRYDIRKEPDPLKYDKESDYIAAYLLSPGQEADARVQGVRALFDLFKGYPGNSSLPVALESWFTPKGVLRASPESVLTVIQGYLGYGASGTYRNRLEVLEFEDGLEFRRLNAVSQLSLPDEFYPERKVAENEWRICVKARLESIKSELARARELLGHL